MATTTKDATMHVRVNAQTKKKARVALRRMGLNVSAAVNLFLHRVAEEQAIPFEVRTENGYTPAQERQIIKDTEWALKYGKRYTDVDTMMDDILKKRS
jgi:DNA-damage-inducible protein J